MKSYLLLKIRIALSLIFKRKISLRKIYNAAKCHISYWLKRPKSGRSPFIMFFETWNECNLRCVACRSMEGAIFNQNPEGDGSSVPKGKLPIETYEHMIREVADDLLLAVLYVNGEPLLYKDIYRALKLTTDLGVATMISTNAMPLTEQNAEKLLDSGVDFIKIAVSGFTQETYSIYHRNGNVDRVKENIVRLVKMNREKGRSLIMVDYIVFRHNDHEIDLFQAFCREMGILFNIRHGITQDQEGIEHLNGKGLEPEKSLCDWLWKILVVNWNGSLLPCCEYATWNGNSGYPVYSPGADSLLEAWNGPQIQAYRKAHISGGRQVIPRCQDCHYKGTGLQA
ncbi:MAG: radical SAM protein [Nitrospinota bacterium]|nr:radical SAM protein [Nitrospinota bacterium]